MATREELQNAWKNVAINARPNPNNKSASANKLRKDLETIDRHFENLAADTQGEVVSGKDAASADTDEGGLGIQEFFKIIGEGARSAQESLDHQSETYIRNRPSFAPETMFRLPKVSASLRLGMEQTRSKGINFFVFERSGQDSKTIEQEISFEVVAAPPPPDALELVMDLPIGQIVASNLTDRETANKRLRSELRRQKAIVKKETSNAARAAAEKYVDAADKMLERDSFRHVLVLQATDKFVLVLVPPDRDPNKPDIGVQIVTLPKTAGSGMQVEAVHLPKTDARTRPLLEVLAAPADRQAEILGQLNRT